MRLIRRLFGWFTLVSLMVWAGAAAYIVMVQYRDLPPAGWPATYGDCVAQWSKPVLDADKARQMADRCASYYALIGAPDAPWLQRLKQQVQGRLSENVIEAYLKVHRPGPGEVVGGPQIIAALGVPAITRMFYETLRQAPQPASITRRVQQRCMLEETRRYPGTPNADEIMMRCMAR